MSSGDSCASTARVRVRARVKVAAAFESLRARFCRFNVRRLSTAHWPKKSCACKSLKLASKIAQPSLCSQSADRRLCEQSANARRVATRIAAFTASNVVRADDGGGGGDVQRARSTRDERRRPQTRLASRHSRVGLPAAAAMAAAATAAVILNIFLRALAQFRA